MTALISEELILSMDGLVCWEKEPLEVWVAVIPLWAGSAVWAVANPLKEESVVWVAASPLKVGPVVWAVANLLRVGRRAWVAQKHWGAENQRVPLPVLVGASIQEPWEQQPELALAVWVLGRMVAPEAVGLGESVEVQLGVQQEELMLEPVSQSCFLLLLWKSIHWVAWGPDGAAN